MTNVIAWPPVGLVGWKMTTSAPVSQSVTFIQGTTRTSSFQRERRILTAVVTGIGADGNGAGYVENLIRLLQGGEHLVRIDAPAPLWALAPGRLNLLNKVMGWVEGATDMEWTDSGTDMLWGDGDYPLAGTPTTDGGWPALTVTGLPPNRMVARPSQRITVTDGTDIEASRVLTAARSDGTGTATIRTFEAFTLDGLVSIGGKESIVVKAMNMPDAVQPASGPWSYTWDFREVFADEYDTWTEVNPWT